MKAAVIHSAGGPEQLKLETRPIPTPKPGWILIRVKAFGLNRSELFTRQGHSPVAFPRILGIEAVGTVADAPGDEFPKGATVATCMGGMGRDFDGGYAEYTCVPAAQVQALETKLAFDVLGALPEMLQTSYGALFTSLQLKAGDKLLVRGGTTSIGLAAAAIARNYGATVISTSRSATREKLLREHGASHVIVDTGKIAEDVQKAFPGGVDKVLELIGVTTLVDSMHCVRVGGIVSMTGIVSGKWSFDNFNPMEYIPSGVCMTVYSGGPKDFMNTPLQELVGQMEAGKLSIPIGKVFRLDEIVQAHQMLESNAAGGKIVVVT